MANAPQQTVQIVDIIDLKFGNGEYLIEYASLGETGYETEVAYSKSYFDVFEIGEKVTVSFLPEKPIIHDSRNYLFWIGIVFFAGSFWIFFLLTLLSPRTSTKKEENSKKEILFGLMLTGVGIMLICFVHYRFNENAVYFNYSHQVSGQLTHYHQKMCGGGRKKNRKKYPCYTRVITYSPIGSSESLTVKDNQYSREKKWDIGTPFQVVYLKSNEASARILDTIESKFLIYLFLPLGIFSLGLGIFLLRLFFRKTFR